MTANAPTLEEWRSLHDVWMRVKALAPWEWMTETDTFGAQHPESNELGFVSVMGQLGEHYGVSLYLGARGLYGFWNMENSAPTFDAQQFLEVPQLVASFEDREELDASDRAVIKQLGLSFRGRQSWPQFRSHRPGCLPWYLEAAEARFLTLALEQLLEVAPRLKADPSLRETSEEELQFVRVPRREGDALIWEDKVMRVPFPGKTYLDIPMNMEAMNRLKALPPGKRRIEMDFFMLRSAIHEKKDERPYFAYALMGVDAQSGMVIGVDLLQPLPTLEAMWATIPAHAAELFANARLRPAAVGVNNDLLHQLLQPLAATLNIRLVKRGRLRALEPAKASLMEHML
jgi:hypothetical protein